MTCTSPAVAAAESWADRLITYHTRGKDYGLVWNVLLDSGGVLIGTKVQIELAGDAIRQS